MSGGLSATATFDFKGMAVDVTYTPALLRVPALWRATTGGNTSESRRLDDALSGVFDVRGSPRALVVLLVEVLDWAPRGAVALPGEFSH
jgi:hypothetical protein